ncbi:Rrf2 family transcriptional regulator [Arcicella rosea]|uniref:Rrf2 family protein n=1 Tax=Arcicella rosea TaxID=502909 RepID=A0A841ETE2_9BACT|nr:Rrf2 family transcriptional regulator [Arcicella rosea]MBB6002721.1 Rrf2 family protein [Arcicella rosea]
MFSKACEYGIKASIFIAEQSLKSNKVGQVAIAKAISSPEAFTAKTLQILTKHGIISSERGPHGGFFFSELQLNSTLLSHIVEVIDGTNLYKGCGLGLDCCNENAPCPVHHQFKQIRDDLRNMLETTLIVDLAIGLKSGLAFLKR